MNRLLNKRIVIIGGYGTFGSLISDQLTHLTNVVIAGRNLEHGRKYANSIGADFVLCNAKDTESLRKTISGAHMVINACGPFTPNDYSIPQTCIEGSCHYIDLADDREYLKGFEQLHNLAKQKGVFACSGASTTPAVTYALTSELIKQFEMISSINIYLSAGNKNNPGVSTFESILSYAGTPIRVWKDGQWKNFMGWGLAEYFEFPAPVGKRFVQLCNVPDLELFPELFQANQVIFKAGVELPVFNIGLSILAYLKKYIPQVNLPWLAVPLVKLSRVFKNFGSYSGGVLVTLKGEAANTKSLAFVTFRNGLRIPAAPSVLLAGKILREGPPAHGAFPCIGFINLGEFQNYLDPFGIRLIS